MDKKQTNERIEFVDEQTNGQNFTNFGKEMSQSNLNSIGQTVFELESGNKNVDRQRNEQTDYTNFERNLVMMVICVLVKFEFDWTNRFRVRVRKQKMWTDRQTSDTSI